jgi:flagellar motor switch protein FliG
MRSLTTNLRKAAILLRSVDAETATTLLAQLSPADAESIRTAIQALGPIDVEERADVAAEFRQVGLIVAEDPRRGVELAISSAAGTQLANTAQTPSGGKPFEFLEQARVESLVPYLAREHGQTVAVVLSYLPPRRAAEVLAALPARLQAETIERLSMLGDTDPASLEVLERELAEWVARRHATRSRDARRPDAVTAILAAADDTARGEILTNLRKVNRVLAEQMAPSLTAKPAAAIAPVAAPPEVALTPESTRHLPPAGRDQRSSLNASREPRKSPPRFAFDDLARMDSMLLAKVLKAVDAEVWVLALAGASEPVVERIAKQMPRSAAKAFRRRLRQLGPTRLRDVEAAQQEVLAVASRLIEQRATNRSATRAYSA